MVDCRFCPLCGADFAVVEVKNSSSPKCGRCGETFAVAAYVDEDSKRLIDQEREQIFRRVMKVSEGRSK